MNSRTGSIKVTICIHLNQDVDVETARQFVDEMEYEIKDTTGKVSISDTEVIESDIGVNEEDEDER